MDWKNCQVGRSSQWDEKILAAEPMESQEHDPMGWRDTLSTAGGANGRLSPAPGSPTLGQPQSLSAGQVTGSRSQGEDGGGRAVGCRAACGAQGCDGRGAAGGAGEKWPGGEEGILQVPTSPGTRGRVPPRLLQARAVLRPRAVGTEAQVPGLCGEV